MTICIVHDHRPGIHVRCHASIDFFSSVERLPPSPKLHHEWISGLGHGSWTPIASYQQGVFVYPIDGLLRTRKHKSVLHKSAALKIELAQRGCVFTSGRKLHHAEVIAGIEACAAMLDPFLTILLRKRVIIQHGLPMRVGGEIVAN